VVNETQHIKLRGCGTNPPFKNGVNPDLWENRPKTQQSKNLVLSKVNIPAPYYTGNVCAAHRSGDFDHFLEVSLWIFCLRYFAIIVVFDM
jgi:hypothetical protein